MVVLAPCITGILKTNFKIGVFKCHVHGKHVLVIKGPNYLITKSLEMTKTFKRTWSTWSSLHSFHQDFLAEMFIFG